MAEILRSKVNRVVKITEPGKSPYVIKVYGSRAMYTGISLPITRAQIERRASAELERKARRTHHGIAVTAGMASTSTINIMPYIEGQPLRYLPPSKWPKPDQVRKLGKFIAESEREIAPRFFRGLVLASQRLGRTIRLYKTGSIAVRRGRYFSFGDATLANILLTSKGLHLLDFEFAHLSNGGFDIGMLTAEIDQLVKRGSALRYARLALLHGYVSAGGRLKSVITWRTRLTKYHAERTKRNGGPK